MGAVLEPQARPGSGRDVRGLRGLGRPNRKGGELQRRFWDLRNASRWTARSKGPSVEPGLVLQSGFRGVSSRARHSPWCSLETRATALQRRRRRHREEDLLHLWAAAAAAKPGNILAGQRPQFGHRLLPPRRRSCRHQLTPYTGHRLTPTRAPPRTALRTRK